MYFKNKIVIKKISPGMIYYLKSISFVTSKMVYITFKYQHDVIEFSVFNKGIQISFFTKIHDTSRVECKTIVTQTYF